MNRSLLLLPAMLAVSSLAFAQSPPAHSAAAPTASSLAPTTSPTMGYCTSGSHEGISFADAEKVSEIVCSELRRQNLLSSHSFQVEITHTGATGSLWISEMGYGGATLRNWSLPIESIQAVYRETPPLVGMVLRDIAGETTSRAPGGRTEKYWYGYQTLLTDALALGLLLSATKEGGSAYASAATYGFGAPLVHLANGNPGRSAISLGMRGLALGSVIAIANGGSSDRDCNANASVFLAALTGLVLFSGVVALDAAVVAKEKRPVVPAVTWNIAPTVGKTGAGLSLGGAF